MTNITPHAPARSYTRVTRAALVAIGALIVVYCVSDHPLYGGAPGFGSTQLALAAAGAALAACALLPIGWVKRILGFTVTGLITLLLAEVAGEIVLGPQYRAVYRLDERLIFELIPGRKSVARRAPINGGDVIRHSINSDGFRGPELLRDNSLPRVLVYGDSFIHATYSESEETFVGQLEALLEARQQRPFEVINAGVSSYGPDQIALRMETELPALEPDLVIVAIYAGNDFGDLLRNKLFRLDAAGALVENPGWRLSDELAIQWEVSRRGSILKRALGSAAGTLRAALRGGGAAGASPAVDLAFLASEAEREYRDFVIERNDVITNTHVDYYAANINLTPDHESTRYEIRLMGAVLERIAKLASDAGVPLVFLFVPHVFDVAGEYEGWSVDHARFPHYDSRNQTRALEDAAKALGVPFVSLYDAYRASGANSLYFHGGDDHWNAAGQRLAAELMVEQLAAAHLIPHE